VTPDLAARRVIIAAYLYYRHDSPIVSDDVFDKTCNYVANNWGLLEPIRQFQLGSEEEIRTTGYHILITQQGEEAAFAVYRRKFGGTPSGSRIKDWLWSDEYRCRYASLGG
jgi:hypothetical protein